MSYRDETALKKDLLFSPRHSISFIEKIIIKDSLNLEEVRGKIILNAKAEINSFFTRDIKEQRATIDTDSLKVVTRFIKGFELDKSMRILHKGLQYDIEHIDNVKEENRILIFRVKKAREKWLMIST